MLLTVFCSVTHCYSYSEQINDHHHHYLIFDDDDVVADKCPHIRKLPFCHQLMLARFQWNLGFSVHSVHLSAEFTCQRATKTDIMTGGVVWQAELTFIHNC